MQSTLPFYYLENEVNVGKVDYVIGAELLLDKGPDLRMYIL